MTITHYRRFAVPNVLCTQMTMRIRWTAENLATFRSLIAAGNSYDEIARIMGGTRKAMKERAYGLGLKAHVPITHRLCAECHTSTTNKKYCSRSCAATQTNRISIKRAKKGRCKDCDTPIRAKSLRCATCRVVVSKSTKTLGELKQELRARGMTAQQIRSYIRPPVSKRKPPCIRCGYNLHTDAAHINAVASFPDTATIGEVNDPSNIMPLCKNCHWEYDHGHISLEDIRACAM